MSLFLVLTLSRIISMGDDTACPNHKRILATNVYKVYMHKNVLSDLFCRLNLSINCTVVQVTLTAPPRLLSRVKI